MTTDRCRHCGHARTALVSDWTVDTLHEHVTLIFKDRDRIFDERYHAQSAALVKSEQALERRLDSLNEFRGQLADQQSTFITRENVDTRMVATASRAEQTHTQMIGRLDSLDARLTRQEGRTQGVVQAYGFLVAAITATAGVIGIVIAVH